MKDRDAAALDDTPGHPGPFADSPNMQPLQDIHRLHDVDALDEALVLAVAMGDRKAFDRLYRRHHPRLIRFLMRQLTRRHLLDDIVNDTMWTVWRKAGDFRGASRVSTWITGVAYRCMLAMLRSDSAPSAEVSEAMLSGFTLDDSASSSQGPASEFELRDWVGQGMNLLPSEQRRTLELAYYMGESCESIAAIMNCPVSTVKARMFHARLRLRNLLPSLGGSTPPSNVLK